MTEVEKVEPRDLWTRVFGERFAWPHFDMPLRAEEFRDGDTLVVRAEIPGIDPDKDVEMHVSDHTLRIRAERKEEKQTEEKGRYRSEFHYGSFSRTLDLPSGASADDVKATYQDGILEVRIPVDTAKAETTKIPVQRV